MNTPQELTEKMEERAAEGRPISRSRASQILNKEKEQEWRQIQLNNLSSIQEEGPSDRQGEDVVLNLQQAILGESVAPVDIGIASTSNADSDYFCNDIAVQQLISVLPQSTFVNFFARINIVLSANFRTVGHRARLQGSLGSTSR